MSGTPLQLSPGDLSRDPTRTVPRRRSQLAAGTTTDKGDNETMAELRTTLPATDSTASRFAHRDGDGDELHVDDTTWRSRVRLLLQVHERSNEETQPVAAVNLDVDAARELRDFLTLWLDERAPAVDSDDLDAWAAERTETIERGDDEPTEYEAETLQQLRAYNEADTAQVHQLFGCCGDAEQLDEPETVTAEAERTVYGRDDEYGHPRQTLTTQAILWTGLLRHKLADGAHVDPEDVARCMVAVKLARDAHEPKRDNRVDGAGYFLALDRLATGR